MRVHVFTHYLPPHLGGVERYTVELWSRVASRGVDVHLFACGSDPSASTSFTSGLPSTLLPCVRLLAGQYPVMLPTPLCMRVLLSRGWATPDVIVTNTRYFATTMLGLLSSRILDRPVLHIEHGSRPLVPTSNTGYLGALLDALSTRAVRRYASHIAGVSAASARFIAGPVASVTVVPNGVDLARFPSRADAPAVPQQRTSILFAGRLIREKGLRLLLEAVTMAGLQNRVEVTAAGDGPDREACERYARTAGIRLICLGAVPHAMMPGVYNRSDLFVHPSYYPEGLPTCILEAAAAQVPVIASDAGGTPELIDETVGWLVPQRSVGALSDALVAAIGSPELREERARALTTRLEVYSWDRIACSVRSLLDEATG